MLNNTKRDGLIRLFNPRHICVIGGNEAEVVVKQLLAFNPTLTIYPINPSRDTIAGITCLKQVTDLPVAPDATFIAIPPAKVVEVIAELNTIGAGGIICYSSGFAELNEDGKALQQQLLNTASHVAVVGPNCYGMINYLDRIALWPDNFGGANNDENNPREQGCALITQSGNLAISLSFQRHGLPLSHLITLGNQADVDIALVINSLLDDRRVKSIGIYLESITDIVGFCEAAHRARQQQVPIIVIKSGASATGAKMAQSHTSAMIADDYLYDCLFQQLGIARTHQLDEFLETLKLATCYGISANNSFVSMSCSGGEAALMADYLEGTALSTNAFSEHTSHQLQSILGERVHISNPLDYHTYIWGNYQALKDCFQTVANDGFQWIVIVLDYPSNEDSDLSTWDTCERAFVDALADTNSCGIMVSTLGENMPSVAMSRLLKQNVVPMQGLVPMTKALGHIINIAHCWNSDNWFIPASTTPRQGNYYFNEYESKSLLNQQLSNQQGLTCPPHQLITSSNRQHDIDYPVVVKAVGRDLLHKTELDAVHLNISNQQQLDKAINGMSSLSELFLVEAMQVKPIAEMLVAVKYDSHFGWLLSVGMGGTAIEILKDFVSFLLPTTPELITKSIQQLRQFPLLNGYRHQPSVNLEPLTAAILQLCEVAMAENNAIAEIEINPLMVYEQHCVIVDALILKSGS